MCTFLIYLRETNIYNIICFSKDALNVVIMEKNYFITGGANGIGLEYTKMALRSGGKVVMTDVNTSLGEQRERSCR